MSLVALNGTACHEGEVVIYASSTVRFNCSYDNHQSTTTYAWFMDNTPLPASQFNAHAAYIPITAGFHTVKCRAVITETAECQCDESQTINITVIGTQHDYYYSAVLIGCSCPSVCLFVCILIVSVLTSKHKGVEKQNRYSVFVQKIKSEG